mmetsp:Transcript_12843/g.30604  ORF Transcript_12843/g.30604 Transcript_12843/m.30604 type:complete len:227 (-) Transcript_12843:744-1424(-)
MCDVCARLLGAVGRLSRHAAGLSAATPALLHQVRRAGAARRTELGRHAHGAADAHGRRQWGAAVHWRDGSARVGAAQAADVPRPDRTRGGERACDGASGLPWRLRPVDGLAACGCPCALLRPAERPLLCRAVQPPRQLVPAMVAVEDTLHCLLLRHHSEEVSTAAAVARARAAHRRRGIGAASGEQRRCRYCRWRAHAGGRSSAGIQSAVWLRQHLLREGVEAVGL